MNERRQGLAASAFSSWLPFLAFFWLSPTVIFTAHPHLFGFRLTVLIPFLFLSLLCLCILWVGFRFFPRLAPAFTIHFSALGIFVILIGLQFPANIEYQMKVGAPEKLNSSHLINEVVLLALSYGVCLLLPKATRERLLSIFSATLFFVQATWVFLTLPFALPKSPSPHTGSQTHANIFHFVFDGFSSHRFYSALQAAGGSKSDLNGFHFYKNARSNYFYTIEAIPSYLRGRLYRGENLSEWLTSYTDDGIFKTVQEAGYTTTMYVVSSIHTPYSPIHNMDHVQEMRGQSKWSKVYLLFNFSTLKLLPMSLYSHLISDKNNFMLLLLPEKQQVEEVNLEYTETYKAPELLQQILDDEQARPNHNQYIFAHFTVPHTPFIYNADCSVRVPGDAVAKNASIWDSEMYDAQTACAAKMILTFLKRLKEMGRYESSTILIHADHGYKNLAPTTENMTMTKTEEASVAEYLGERRFTPQQVDLGSRPLFMIKAPEAREAALVEKNDLLQLYQLPEMVLYYAGLQKQPPGFSDTAHIYYGMLQYTTASAWPYYQFSNNLLHFEYSLKSGWATVPESNPEERSQIQK